MIRMANYCRKAGIFLLIAAIIGGSSAAWAVNTEPWTTTGSAGTVDDADISIAVFSGSIVSVSGAVATATLDMRYNVVAVDGLLNPSDAMEMKVCYRDNGGPAQVIVKLYACNLNTGATTLMMTFDSNSFPQPSSFQSQRVTDCTNRTLSCNFFTYVYYIEAALKKFSSTGAPAISSISIGYTTCP